MRTGLELLLEKRYEPAIAPFFKLAFEKRLPEELYDLSKDPHQLVNVAEDVTYAEAKKKMRSLLEDWRMRTADPRSTHDDDRWDRYPYFGADGAARR